jgi:DNA-binding transcriptional regulator YiaG
MSMKSLLRARGGPRVQIRDIDRVRSGSRERVRLVPSDAKAPLDTVAIARALVRRGAKASVARDVVDRLSDGHAALVVVPHFDQADMGAEMLALGVKVGQPRAVSGNALAQARGRLALSQEQFANAVGIEVRTLQNWEQHDGDFDGPTALLIKLLERRPDIVQSVASDDVPLPS